MKIRWWQFWKWKSQADLYYELSLKIEDELHDCETENQFLKFEYPEFLKNKQLEEELKLLKAAYFEQVKKSTDLEHLLTPKRDIPAKRDKKT